MYTYRSTPNPLVQLELFDPATNPDPRLTAQDWGTTPTPIACMSSCTPWPEVGDPPWIGRPQKQSQKAAENGGSCNKMSMNIGIHLDQS